MAEVMPLTRDEIERYLRGALKQEGLTIVPKEPTKEMIDAACEDYADFTKHGPRIGKLWGSEAVGIWRAMLAAAGKSETE